MELKNRMVKGVFWTVIERGGALVVQMTVTLVLTRLLTPADFGLIGMLTVFSMISYIFIDGGFTQSLIRKAQPSQDDYSSIFWLNLLVGTGMYLLLCALAWPIALFYGQPQLIRIAPVVFLTLPLVALITVQHVIFTRAMNFRLLATVSFASMIVSGGIALWMALTGWGVWALVWQPITHGTVNCALLWLSSPWRPQRRISKKSIRSLAGFGSRIFLASLINQVFNSLVHMFVGRTYGVGQFGLYDQSRKLKEIPSETLSAAVTKVTFPALSTIQDDTVRLRESSRKIVIVMSFVLFPVMAGLIVTAQEFFPLILGGKWDGAIPYFQIFCLTALAIPSTVVMQNLIKVRGRSRSVLDAEIVRKAFALVVVAVTIPISIRAVIWGQVIYWTFSMAVGMFYGQRLVAYRIGAQLRDLLPVAALTLSMAAGVLLIGLVLGGRLTLGWLLAVKIATGVTIYLAGAKLTRLEAWNDTRQIFRGLVAR